MRRWPPGVFQALRTSFSVQSWIVLTETPSKAAASREEQKSSGLEGFTGLLVMSSFFTVITIFGKRRTSQSEILGNRLTLARAHLLAGHALRRGGRGHLRIGRGIIVICVLQLLSACATSSIRPERSTLGCAESVVASRVPADLPDKQQHCLAAGFIARYCSRTEAYLAAAGKEFKDMFGRGDAEWADWRADRAGMECASGATNDEGIVSCCARYEAAITDLPK